MVYFDFLNMKPSIDNITFNILSFKYILTSWLNRYVKRKKIGKRPLNIFDFKR